MRGLKFTPISKRNNIELKYYILLLIINTIINIIIDIIIIDIIIIDIIIIDIIIIDIIIIDIIIIDIIIIDIIIIDIIIIIIINLFNVDINITIKIIYKKTTLPYTKIWLIDVN